MSRPHRPIARHRPARTAQAALSGAKTLDEAAAILVEIEGEEALCDARAAAEHNQQCRGQIRPYQSELNHRLTPMPDTSPSIGIFWAITGPDGRTHLLTYPCALADGEAYGDCVASPAAHYDTWQGWRRGRPKPPLALLALVIARDEYEHWPRARIVYEQTPDRFVIYADRQFLTPLWLTQICTVFHLPPERITALSDLHYRRARTIGPP